MNYTGKHLKKVALKLGYVTIEGKKHTRVYDEEGRYITTLPRGKIKAGTLAAILKQLEISEAQLKKIL
jgi:predicted RNA binding protein YcfA (HicA-like mRNA interferase family)